MTECSYYWRVVSAFVTHQCRLCTCISSLPHYDVLWLRISVFVCSFTKSCDSDIASEPNS